jgi:HEAT repeat protein
MEMLMKKHRVDKKAFDSNFRAGVSFPINESGTTRKIRSIRNLKKGTSGPERDAADRMLKKVGSPLTLPGFVKRKSKKKYG